MALLSRFSVSVDADLLEKFDRFVDREGYPTRSEAVKSLMRDALISDQWSGGKDVAGALMLVYDHHRTGIAGRLMETQHDFDSIIIATQHVHLDHATCLEIVTVRGRAAEVERLIRGLKSVKGIKHLAPIMTASGEAVP